MKSCIEESIWFLIPMYSVLWSLAVLFIVCVWALSVNMYKATKEKS